MSYAQKGYEKEFKTNEINQHLTFDKDVLGGVPTIRETTIPAYKVFELLAEGKSIQDIANTLNLPDEKIKGMLDAMSEMFEVSFYEE